MPLTAGSTLFCVRRAVEGDRPAQEDFFRRMRPRVQAWVATRLGRRLRVRIDVEDLVQDILLKAFRGLERFRPRDRSALYVWMFRIAEHALADMADYHGAQRRNLDQEVPFEAAAQGRYPDPGDAMRLAETHRKTLEALADLPPRYRAVLRLRLIEGRANATTAEILGVTPNTAAVLHLRALRAWRERLRRLGIEPPGRTRSPGDRLRPGHPRSA
jgi:RNA polymerase sigma-70 factor (ECF subfamily)